jgi:FAD/FMN-containing dehydrogenase
MNALAAALREVVGPDHVIDDPDITVSYATDWTRRFIGEASVVVRPGSTDEVAAVLRACAEAGAPVVPQGGNTGLVGGSVPRGEPMVVLSTLRLAERGEVDAGASQVTLGAGVTMASWRAHAREAGFDAPVDFASRDSATVGGAVATNAGGSRVVRFGTMRSQVTGLHAVLADGSVIGSLAGLPKETIGVHWPSLLAGSEGTLGVITEVRLKLVPWYRHTATAMVATKTLADAVAVLAALRGGVPNLDAVELILPEAMVVVGAHLGATPPVGDSSTGAYVVVELADHEDPTDALLGALAGLGEVQDAAVTTEGPARERLVAFRDRITESINAQGVPLKLDVAVPVGSLDELMAAVRRTLAAHGGRVVPFGHLAEGNVHVNVLEPGDPAAITRDVLTTAAGLGGTISAEHGVGIAKTHWIHLVRTPAELAAAAAVKRALDPAGILNPGVLDPSV